MNKAEFAAYKAAITAKILTNIGCSSATKCGSAIATVTITTFYQLPAGRRLQSALSFPSGEIEVVAAMPAAEAASFAALKQYATNLVGNTPAFLTGLLGVTVSGTTAVVEASGSTMNFIQLAISPSPPPPRPPSPPPKPLGVGEMSMVGAVKDYTTSFNSNLDGCYAKMAAPRITADIAAALGFSESLVHVTPIEEATGRLWDNNNTGANACPAATGRRLEARGLLGHGECTTIRPTSCTCSTGACFMQTRFVIVIRVPQADAAAAAASAAAITTLIAATSAAMYSTPALTTLFPSLLLDGDYRSTIQLSGSSATTVSSSYTTTFYYSSPSPPPPTPVVVPPPPSTPVVVPPVVVTPPVVCEDKQGKYRDKKCAKKQQKGKCSKKRIAKKCRKTCDLCN